MAISEDVLNKYLDNVPGNRHSEIRWKKQALRALAATAANQEVFMTQATPFVQDEEGDCGMLFKCADGSCVADKTLCDGRGGLASPRTPGQAPPSAD
jgi:hypothetical protein